MPIAWDDLGPHNQLLSDPRWNTGLYYSGAGRAVDHSHNLVPFPPYTNGVTYLHFECTAIIQTVTPAYPFAWDASGDQIIAAISYPRSDSIDCYCDAGGRIIALADNHTFEAPVVGYIEPMDHKFMVNVLEGISGIIPLPPCKTPPGVPAASIDTCGAPGESFTIHGENLYSPMFLTIGSIAITPDDYGADSTSMTFDIPNLPQGVYRVKIKWIDTSGTSHTFEIGKLKVYCEWVDLKTFAKGCYFIGDTVYFTGENFSATANVAMKIVSPEGDTTLISDFTIFGSDSGMFVIPAGIDTSQYRYFFVKLKNTDIGNWDQAYIQIPCPCPGQDTLYSVSRSPEIKLDTKDPEVTPDSLDSCFILEIGGGNLTYTTSVDSFMSVPSYWPDREPTTPVSVELSTDGGATWNYIANNLPNIGAFRWAPPATGASFLLRISAVDSLGNKGSGNVAICVENILAPPLTGTLREWSDCEPDSFVFTIRDSSIINSASMTIEFDSLKFYYPDSMYWTNETTLVFFPPRPYPDSSTHWLRMSEMAQSKGGLRISPDNEEALEGLFSIDLLAPSITPLSPLPNTNLPSIAIVGSVSITDWSGVDENSIYVRINGYIFDITNPALTFNDSILQIDFAALNLSDTNDYELCVFASDLDTPEICAATDSTCYPLHIFICNLRVEAGENITINFRDSVQLQAHDTLGYGTVNYTWRPSLGLTDSTISDPIASPFKSTQYIVTAIDDSSCEASDTIVVEIVSNCYAHPQPFTPDGNQVNDYGKFEYPDMGENNGTVHIYDLDNKLVRELQNGDVLDSESGMIYWDGKDSEGNIVSNGVYLYMISVDGKDICKGTIYVAK